MLYNLIIILLIPIMSLLVFFSYRQGIKDGRALKEEKELPKVVPEIKIFKKSKLDPEVKKLNDILDNIDNYNGSPVGQKVVK